MRIGRKILYAVALSFLFSITLAFDHPPAEGGRKGSVEVYFSASEETACHSHHEVFSLEKLRDLYICVVWPELLGTHVELLTFRAPDGNIYQVLTVPFTTPGMLGPAEVDVAGRHHQVKGALRGGYGETVVLALLPVAGTYITQYNLVGRWTVEVSLDGQLIDREHVTLQKGK